ncbi:MAG: hypothetical protein IKL77_01165 [Clostridia bacterium]|nr:hypothetical protein [Clostridia bacterium]
MKNLKNKLFAAILSLAIVFTAFGTVGVVTAFAAGEHTHTYVNGICETVPGETHYEEPVLNNNGTADDTTDDYYEIGNAGNLYWFAEHVNYREGNVVPNTGVNAKLTQDIVVNENVIVNGLFNDAEKDTFRVWTPIGYLQNNVGGFMGTFDGQGFTVSGLYFNNAEVTNVGLFFRVGDYKMSKPGTVKNVGVIDSYFYGKSSVGAIAGAGNEKSTITNCFSHGCFIYGNTYLGGITGALLNGATVSNCYSTSTVKGNQNNVGSIAGMLSTSNVKNSYYLSGVATDGNGVIQNGLGNGLVGKAREDVAAQTKGFATAKEVVMEYGGVDAYIDYLERVLPKVDVANQEEIGRLQGELYLATKTVFENADKANQEEIERLQGELDTAEQALADAKTALENADKLNQKEIVRLQGELDTAEQALADAKTALENADKANQDEMERLQGELDTAEQALIDAKTALTQKDAELKQAIEQNKALAEIDVDTLEEELLAAKAQLTALSGANKTLGVIGLVFGCVSFVGMAVMAFLFIKKKGA